MAENSGIEWTTHTFNPWWGCTKVSAACDHCYAETFAKRFGTGWGNDAPRRLFGDKHWQEPLKWDGKAAESGERPRVFCASMADVFEKNDSVKGERERLWRLIDATPHLDWLLLTKRPHLMNALAPQDWRGGWPDNVWAMTTVEDQVWANARLDWLCQVPARVRGVSMEPLFGFVDLSKWIDRLSWIITGGESGDQARPGHPGWYRDLRDQAQAADVAFLFKQWGNWLPIDQPWEQDNPAPLGANEQWINRAGGQGYHGEEVWRVRNVGKKVAGRVLDGRTWDGYPATRQAVTTA